MGQDNPKFCWWRPIVIIVNDLGRSTQGDSASLECSGSSTCLPTVQPLSSFTILYHPFSNCISHFSWVHPRWHGAPPGLHWAPLGSTQRWFPWHLLRARRSTLLESWETTSTSKWTNISNISNISNIIYQYLPGVQKKTEFNHINNHINNHIQSKSPDKIK